jgi:hypothetical protein
MAHSKQKGEQTGRAAPSGGTRRRIGAPTVIILVVLFAAGLLHWLLFFHSGNMSFNAHDWQKEYTYYSVLKEAIQTGAIPYHVTVAFHGTNRFLALPETNLSPQILLLRCFFIRWASWDAC